MFGYLSQAPLKMLRFIFQKLTNRFGKWHYFFYCRIMLTKWGWKNYFFWKSSNRFNKFHENIAYSIVWQFSLNLIYVSYSKKIKIILKIDPFGDLNDFQKIKPVSKKCLKSWNFHFFMKMQFFKFEQKHEKERAQKVWEVKVGSEKCKAILFTFLNFCNF